MRFQLNPVANARFWLVFASKNKRVKESQHLKHQSLCELERETGDISDRKNKHDQVQLLFCLMFFCFKGHLLGFFGWSSTSGISEKGESKKTPIWSSGSNLELGKNVN